MPATTTRLAIPYPVASDPNNVPSDMQNLANRLDLIVSPMGFGVLSARPAAGNEGFEYFATDTNILYLDNGTSWIAVNPTATIGGTPSTSNPGDVAAAGTSGIPAMTDHKHARESYAGTGGLYGSANTVARGDHQHSQVHVTPMTWAVSGQIQVPSGANGYLPPQIVNVQAGVTCTLLGLRTVCRSGTVTFEVVHNGAAVTGLTGLSATTSESTLIQPTSTTTLNDGDTIAPVVTAVSSTPDGLSVALMIEYSAAA